LLTKLYVLAIKHNKIACERPVEAFFEALSSLLIATTMYKMG
jgi:hypothetical protein